MAVQSRGPRAPRPARSQHRPPAARTPGSPAGGRGGREGPAAAARRAGARFLLVLARLRAARSPAPPGLCLSFPLREALEDSLAWTGCPSPSGILLLPSGCRCAPAGNTELRRAKSDGSKVHACGGSRSLPPQPSPSPPLTSPSRVTRWLTGCSAQGGSTSRCRKGP